MAFVPGYEHDIFVSYAHVDNEPYPGVEEGWVSTLVNGVKIVLAQKLGRSEGYSLWKDYLLSSHTPLTPEIIQTVKSSATMTLVLSPGYLASPWCLKELEAFREAVGQRQRANSRVFIVERDRIDESERPAEFQDVRGYRFWLPEKEAKHPRILGDPIPNPHDPAHLPYYDQLRDLSCDLAEELKRLKSLPEPAVSEPQVQEPDTRPAVFLAEVTDDLLQQRDEVRRYLDQAGIRTLPQGFLYLSQPDDFEQAVDRDLKDCKLFVQLLSDIGGRKPPGRPTYSRIQYERALKAGIPILQWRSPALNLDVVTDADQFALLTGDQVFVGNLEAFQHELVMRALAEPNGAVTEGAMTEGAMTDIFLSYAREDRERVRPLVEALQAAGGWSVWWAGKTFDEVIEQALNKARCVLVV